MKCRLIGLTEEDIEKGLRTGQIIEIDKVEITGDNTGLDLWYYCGDNCFHDMCLEELEENQHLKKTMKYLCDYLQDIQNEDFNINFKYSIDV